MSQSADLIDSFRSPQHRKVDSTCNPQQTSVTVSHCFSPGLLTPNSASESTPKSKIKSNTLPMTLIIRGANIFSLVPRLLKISTSPHSFSKQLLLVNRSQGRRSRHFVLLSSTKEPQLVGPMTREASPLLVDRSHLTIQKQVFKPFSSLRASGNSCTV